MRFFLSCFGVEHPLKKFFDFFQKFSFVSRAFCCSKGVRGQIQFSGETWKLNIHSSGTLLVSRETLSRDCRCATTFRKEVSDKTYTMKAGLLPVVAMTGTRNNDTSVIRGSAIMKAERWDSYEPGQQPGAWWIPFVHLGDEVELNATT